MLMASYPSAAPNDPEAYATDIVTLLMEYSFNDAQWAIRECKRAHSYPPSHADVYKLLREHVNARLEYQWQQQKRETLCLPVPPDMDRTGRPTYDDLKAKYGENWGIDPKAVDAVAPDRLFVMTPARKMIAGVASAYHGVVQGSDDFMTYVRKIMNRTCQHMEVRGWDLNGNDTDNQTVRAFREKSDPEAAGSGHEHL